MVCPYLLGKAVGSFSKHLIKEGYSKEEILELANSFYLLLEESRRLQSELDKYYPDPGAEILTPEAKEIAFKLEMYEPVLSEMIEKLGGYAALKQFYPALQDNTFQEKLYAL